MKYKSLVRYTSHFIHQKFSHCAGQKNHFLFIVLLVGIVASEATYFACASQCKLRPAGFSLYCPSLDHIYVIMPEAKLRVGLVPSFLKKLKQ